MFVYQQLQSTRFDILDFTGTKENPNRPSAVSTTINFLIINNRKMTWVGVGLGLRWYSTRQRNFSAQNLRKAGGEPTLQIG